MLRSSNPAMKVFEAPQRWDDLSGSGPAAKTRSGQMTMGGTLQATAIQLGCALVGAIAMWIAFAKGAMGAGGAMPITVGIIGFLIIGGFILARKPQAAIVMGPILSAAYGAVAGAMSYAVAMAVGAMMAKNPELVGADQTWTREALVAQGSVVILQAMLLTIGVALAMLAIRAFNLFRVGGTFAKIVMMCTMAVGFLYIASILLRLITGGGFAFIHSTGPIGIAFSGFVVVLASINLLMAFQSVEDGVRDGQPKFMEWYAGYAVVSTIIWLYIEILRLLYKLYVIFGSRE
ncbi:MAG: Bax inhibitor-1/YccA family protein [Phycisphaeraceae bacterium]|nr:Bax inhibitor-1/YccA family protein [Phycisphaeraceae bacterium]MCW5754625.1 Bax inhibitor-1/YccA family protein [Phycisphaeraceae bacterium]